MTVQELLSQDDHEVKHIVYLVDIGLLTQLAFAQQQSVQMLINDSAKGKAKTQEEQVSPEHKAILKRLERKWIVISVERDGEPNTAQIGQKNDDEF